MLFKCFRDDSAEKAYDNCGYREGKCWSGSHGPCERGPPPARCQDGVDGPHPARSAPFSSLSLTTEHYRLWDRDGTSCLSFPALFTGPAQLGC